jgi:hypothetical protein
MGVEQTLSLTDVACGPGFATSNCEDVGLFTFVQGIAQWQTLGADHDAGTTKARSSGYGFLGGIGIGNRDWSVGYALAMADDWTLTPKVGVTYLRTT